MSEKQHKQKGIHSLCVLKQKVLIIKKVACKYCGSLLGVPKYDSHYEYRCPRCDALIHKSGEPVSIILLLGLATVILFVLGVSTPLFDVRLTGEIHHSLLDVVDAMFKKENYTVALIMFTTVIAVPAVMLLLLSLTLLFSFLGHKKGIFLSAMGYKHLKEWNMSDVYLLTMVISLIKLEELTDMRIDDGFYLFMAYLFAFFLLTQWFNENDYCKACEERIYKRTEHSYTKTIIYSLSAAVFLIPSYILPIMPVHKFTEFYNNTIIDGIVFFIIEDQEYFIAAVIFLASFWIPILKILSLLGLVIMAKYDLFKTKKRFATKLFRVVDGIGKYSMVDVFLLTVLIGYVQFDNLVYIEGGDALIPFGMAVILTMFAAKSFDTRLLWDETR